MNQKQIYWLRLRLGSQGQVGLHFGRPQQGYQSAMLVFYSTTFGLLLKAYKESYKGHHALIPTLSESQLIIQV